MPLNANRMIVSANAIALTPAQSGSNLYLGSLLSKTIPIPPTVVKTEGLIRRLVSFQSEVSPSGYASLSNSSHDQRELLGDGQQRRRFGWVVKPFRQLAVGEQIQPQHRCQVGQR